MLSSPYGGLQAAVFAICAQQSDKAKMAMFYNTSILF
jgi:hypothetical protein